MMQRTDRELVQLTLAGKMEAFGELVRKYQGAVYGLAYHRVGNFADAQDIAQEAFIKAYRKLRQLEQPDRFAAWLNAITINECRMWLRQREQAVSLEEAGALPEVNPSAGEEWDRRELQEAIRKAVASLSEKNRLAVTLHYLSGLSYQEISAFLKVPVTVIEGRLYRARKRLKEEMMAMVEESFTDKKLSEDFTSQVLRELTLFPIEEGYVSISFSDRVGTLIMGQKQGGKDAGLIALAMKRADTDAIFPALSPGSEAAQVKARAFECTRAILEAFNIRFKQVALYLDEGRQCRAKATLTKGKTAHHLEMRPSDALALAARMKAPVYADEAVLQQGKAGEEGLACTFEESLEEMRQELQACHQRTQLEGKAFEVGLVPEEGRDTVRYLKDEAQNKLYIEVIGSEIEPLVLSLSDHLPAVRQLWSLSRQPYTTMLHNDKEYRTHYTAQGDELAVKFVPVAAEDSKMQ